MSTEYLSQAQVERIGPDNIRFACKHCGNVRFMKQGQLVFGRVADSANVLRPQSVRALEKSANTTQGACQ